MTTLLATDTGAAAALAGGIGILWLLLWLLFFIIGIVWLIFPFVVWVKLNRIIRNTDNAAQNLYGLCGVVRQEFEKSSIPQ